MRKRITMLMLAFLVGMATMNAQDENLKVHFDFSNVSGKQVTDAVGGIKGRMLGSASVVKLGEYNVLDLGNESGYFDMTKNTGAIVRKLGDFTISVYYRVGEEASLSGAGRFLWAFSTLSASTETSGKFLYYRLNAQRMAASTAGYGSEVGMEVGSEATKGRWVHFLYRQTGTRGEVYLDGKRVMQKTGMPVLSDVMTTTLNYCWIGRAPFTGDSYLQNTLVADFRIYDVALGTERITQLATVAKSLEQAYRYGNTGDFTSLASKLAECRVFVASATEGYAPNALAELQDEINLADYDLALGRASQSIIDHHVSMLDNLLATAKATAGYTAKRVGGFPDGGHGFVHPGGLVSQADIDRAKQLLADGDSRITRAWEILCANGYSDANVATWPTPTVIRGGGSGQNYMNCARGAAMAYQNALRWKIGGTKANADAAVRIMMQWARECNGLGGDTNVSLASGIYGHEFANAAELMRDYEGWSREDFETFKQWMIRVFYNPAIDFLRRRHDTWLNWRYSNLGERPGHYWSNWGLCNALCVMSIGILCDDVHMYNQGVSFYKYDHQGTYNPDRSSLTQIINDGCDEFIGNLVPILIPDERGPFGYLGQMQESGRDQGHSLMALGLAIDICQVGYNQGDDLYAYMDDRIAAGAEFVAAMNFGDVDAATLPWKNYNYADCRGTMGAGWLMTGPNTGGAGEYRPYWDRLLGYYEGIRGVKMQYAEKASAKVCPDGGGGNYSQNSGGFDHLGFSTLTHWRPAIDASQAAVPLSGDIVYKGVTYKNQTNLGGLKYKYEVCPSKAVPADGAEVTLIPQLPEGVADNGQWQWETGEKTRELTVRADRSYIYRVTYTADNGTQSQQSFAIAVCGDAQADPMRHEITVNGEIESTTEKTILSGTSVILYAEATTGWTDDYLWDNGTKGTIVTLNGVTSSRSYTCQYANQSGAVSEVQFQLNVVPARQHIWVDGGDMMAAEAEVFPGAEVVLELEVPGGTNPQDITWSDGSHGTRFTVPVGSADGTYTATYLGETYTYTITLKEARYSYYTDLLTTANGYTHITSTDQLDAALENSYFVLCADEADLMLHLSEGKENGNKAIFYRNAVSPLTDLSAVFTLEAFDGGYCLRNIDYDGLLLQTEANAAWNFRTHDQPYGISWARFLFASTGSAWTIENGTYPGNWLGLWTPANGYADGEELACNKTGIEIAHYQLFAIPRNRFHADYLNAQLSASNFQLPLDATPLLASPDFAGNGWPGWTVAGTWGNQRFNGAAEVWHSTGFSMQQTISGLPAGSYTVTCQMANGEGSNTGYLFATANGATTQAVVKQSCAGSDFDTQRNRMAASANYGLLSVEATVGEDGQLTLGIKEPSTDTTWLVWDNFRLICNSITTDGISQQIVNYKSSNNKWYDLSGRRIPQSSIINNTLRKGIYIIGGKKVVVQ